MGWHTDPLAFWNYTDVEAEDNAVEIYNVLRSLGFNYNAICGVLGNIGYESGYNPWKWQINTGTTSDILASTDTYLISHQTGHAYGLFQNDPAGDYINSTIAQSYPEYGPNFSDIAGSNLDGVAQIKNVEYYCIPVLGSWIPTATYNLSYANFKISTQSASYLALAWLYEYERGTYSASRETFATYWYNNLQRLIDERKHKKMSWIYYLKRRV